MVRRVAIIVWSAMWVGVFLLQAVELSNRGGDGYYGGYILNVLIAIAIYTGGLVLLLRRRVVPAAVMVAALAALGLGLLPVSVGFLETTLDCGSAYAAFDDGPSNQTLERLHIPADVYQETFRDATAGFVRLSLVGGADHVCRQGAIPRFLIGGAIAVAIVASATYYAMREARSLAGTAETGT